MCVRLIQCVHKHTIRRALNMTSPTIYISNYYSLWHTFLHYWCTIYDVFNNFKIRICISNCHSPWLALSSIAIHAQHRKTAHNAELVICTPAMGMPSYSYFEIVYCDLLLNVFMLKYQYFQFVYLGMVTTHPWWLVHSVTVTKSVYWSCEHIIL